MGLFDCLKSERSKEIDRLVEKKRYGAVYYQCGYDPLTEVSDALCILAGPPSGYDRLTRVIARDASGTVAKVLLSEAKKDYSLLPDKMQKEFFEYGIRAQALERSERELVVALHQQGFSDPIALKEIKERRAPELILQGLPLVADDISMQAKIKDTRAQYIQNRTRELDQRILETQKEAVDAVKDQFATAPDCLALLSQKRDELKTPYETRKANLGNEFDTHFATALDHIRHGRIIKAYTMLSDIGHDVSPPINRGIRDVSHARAPSWLLAEILKLVDIDPRGLAPFETHVFYRPGELALAAIVTRDNVTYVRESFGSPAAFFNMLLGSLPHWQSADVRMNYSPIEKELRRLSDEAKSRQHRD